MSPPSSATAVTLLLLYGRELTALFEEGVQAVEVAAQLLVKALRKTDKYLRFWKQRAQVRRAKETGPLNSGLRDHQTLTRVVILLWEWQTLRPIVNRQCVSTALEYVENTGPRGKRGGALRGSAQRCNKLFIRISGLRMMIRRERTSLSWMCNSLPSSVSLIVARVEVLPSCASCCWSAGPGHLV